MSAKLALLGGPKTRSDPFPPYPIIGEEEKKAVLEVLNEGRLSTFIAAPGEHFLGGKRIRQFEREFAEYHGVKYAVAFNSATAALHAAVVAVGVQPGEEVITTPYTFTSTATCALMHNAVPVFADIDPETFCLDPVAVEKSISPLSKALIPVHLFGHPAPMDELMSIAKKYELKVIEDCAQAPGAIYAGKKVGTIGDCGVFSFQETKNIMTGEGGMLITNDEKIARVAQLVRNHGEVVLETMPYRTYITEMLGYNYRMTELEAAIGICQLRHLDEWNEIRIRLASYLTKKLREFDGLTPPKIREGCKHVFYVYPLLYDESKTGIPRDIFAEALKAEGIPVSTGYVKPLYLSPLYQERRAYAFKHYRGNVSYHMGICPVAEEMYFKKMLILPVVRPPASENDMDDIVDAVRKIFENKDELIEYARQKKLQI
ncbi:MAG: DegT/DnrJ/EryC1/StrS family aminotransferase [Candidatus Hadarchaeales archaeon]